MERKYLITEDQLDQYKKIFDVSAERIKDLCDDEKADIVYGFELGQIYSMLKQCFVELVTIESQIIKQEDEN